MHKQLRRNSYGPTTFSSGKDLAYEPLRNEKDHAGDHPEAQPAGDRTGPEARRAHSGGPGDGDLGRLASAALSGARPEHAENQKV